MIKKVSDIYDIWLVRRVARFSTLLMRKITTSKSAPFKGSTLFNTIATRAPM